MSHYLVPKSSETLLLDQCEAIIEEGLKTLEKVERAFAIIEQMQLHKRGFENLDSYYKERWAEQIDLTHLCQIQNSNLNSK
ncbi:MAG: hypothetical protein K0U38_00485 [Epsilonproteobacteria bacterium]|nr:hypothetical protein [Campylobacterota bacterium]